MRRLIFWFTGGGVYGGGAPAPPPAPRPPPAGPSKVPRTALILASVSSAAFFTESGTAGAAGRFQLSVRVVTAGFMAAPFPPASFGLRAIGDPSAIARCRVVWSAA